RREPAAFLFHFYKQRLRPEPPVPFPLGQIRPRKTPPKGGSLRSFDEGCRPRSASRIEAELELIAVDFTGVGDLHRIAAVETRTSNREGERIARHLAVCDLDRGGFSAATSGLRHGTCQGIARNFEFVGSSATTTTATTAASLRRCGISDPLAADVGRGRRKT